MIKDVLFMLVGFYNPMVEEYSFDSINWEWVAFATMFLVVFHVIMLFLRFVLRRFFK